MEMQQETQNKDGRIVSINVSDKKGTVKHAVQEAELLEDFGIKDDAHAGKWHRQVSLLAFESFEQFADTVKIDLAYGVFGENLLVEGFDLAHSQVGDRFVVNDQVELEITQIGKECHKACEIRSIVGNCIMPTEGIFAVVKRGGTVRVGDRIVKISAGQA